jgi:hypothetical protein
LGSIYKVLYICYNINKLTVMKSSYVRKAKGQNAPYGLFVFETIMELERKSAAAGMKERVISAATLVISVTFAILSMFGFSWYYVVSAFPLMFLGYRISNRFFKKHRALEQKIKLTVFENIYLLN